MTNITARLAGIATLALAVLPALALTATAHAAPTVTANVIAKVQVGDLNLASADGQAILRQRIDDAARRFCSDVTSRSTLDTANAFDSCRVAVRAEVNEKLASEIRLANRN